MLDVNGTLYRSDISSLSFDGDTVTEFRPHPPKFLQTYFG